MTTHNSVNERTKRQYLTYLKEAKRQSEATTDAVAAALSRFEADTHHRSFKSFHHMQAVAFKRHLATQPSEVTGKHLSKATMHATLSHLRRFFQWLSGQPGYKSRLTCSDADYFSLSENETRIATAQRARPSPTLEQAKHVIEVMPHANVIEQRDRALVAFILLTGARDSAVASLKLKHVDLAARAVYQDAREVHTKFRKSFTSFFFPIGDDIEQIFSAYVTNLRGTYFWGNDDPLFPATLTSRGASLQFEADGLSRSHWRSAAPIRTIFRNAFQLAGFPYFNPHSFRRTLVQVGQRLCQTPEQFKCWSQNLGHEGVLTTFLSYGEVELARQGDIIRGLGNPLPDAATASELLQQLAQHIQKGDSSRAT